ncbi:hypothetical protein Goshw_020843 [Gossypium schwendimanii]|uniref:Uncharacterized protein n=1 Tax=Gossypium schwendimanii TaxID=34291 RepID=A0A7J9MUT5_GOSSC|nr:hypothetical protein [Gossypium schwendimanii]
MSNAWNQTRQIKILAMGPSMTPEYSQWRDQRVNDNIPVLNPETTRSLEEHLQEEMTKVDQWEKKFQNTRA